MPTPDFVVALRALIGHQMLWLSTAAGIVLDHEGRVLLVRRADNGAWTLPGGIIEPAEQPADAAVREVFEETGVVAVPETLSSVTVFQPITYPNGDHVQYLELAFRCRAAGGEARVNDDESVEVGWYALDDLPAMDSVVLDLIGRAAHGAPETAFTFSGLREVLGSGIFGGPPIEDVRQSVVGAVQRVAVGVDGGRTPDPRRSRS